MSEWRNYWAEKNCSLGHVVSTRLQEKWNTSKLSNCNFLNSVERNLIAFSGTSIHTTCLDSLEPNSDLSQYKAFPLDTYHHSCRKWRCNPVHLSYISHNLPLSTTPAGATWDVLHLYHLYKTASGKLERWGSRNYLQRQGWMSRTRENQSKTWERWEVKNILVDTRLALLSTSMQDPEDII